MSWSSLRRWLSALTGKKKRSTNVVSRQLHAFDVLEDRVTPAQLTWNNPLGGDLMVASNWLTGVAPSADDALVFPQLGAGITITNNLGAPALQSITFAGGGYTLTGNEITLGDPDDGAGFILAKNNPGTGINTIQTDIRLAADNHEQFVTVTHANIELHITGRIRDTAASVVAAPEFTKDGDGLLYLAADNSAYRGTITVSVGTLVVQHASALGSTASPTVVLQNSELRLDNVGIVSEPLTLQGRGQRDIGALVNQTGSNEWAGSIRMDAPTTFGTQPGTQLRISGSISDFNGSQRLTKELDGTLILANRNTYRGQTDIVHGVLAIAHPQALGSTTAGTVVYSDILGSAQLRIDGGSYPGGGFRVSNETLTLNGPGFGGQTLLNNTGDNEWFGAIRLNTAVNIGVNTNTQLTVTGVLQDTGLLGNLIDKNLGGTLVLFRDNTFGGALWINQGIVRIKDSNALGSALASTIVQNGATLELDVKQRVEDLAIIAATGLPAVDSVTGDNNSLHVPEPLTITGFGFNVAGVDVGALYSNSGINRYDGDIFLIGTASIGVNAPLVETPDDTYLTQDWSLTVPGAMSGGSLVKQATGHLILPVANDYTGTTTINAGWVTIRNDEALGVFQSALNDLNQPRVTVVSGASLHLLPDSPTSHLTIWKNITIAGDGVVHANPKISGKGAIVSLGGDNVFGERVTGSGAVVESLGGIITLNGPAGIGVTDPIAPLATSELLIKSTITEPMAPSAPVMGHLSKWGPRRMILQANNLFSGDFNVNEGVIRVQNDGGLGASTITTLSTTTIASGAAIELMNSVETENGGISDGLQFSSGEHLVINGPGNTFFGLLPFTVWESDNLFRGSITLRSNAAFDIKPGARLIVSGAIDDAGSTEPGGFSDLILNSGTLDLSGTNTYRGRTFVNPGSVLSIRNTGALGYSDGTAATGTFVAAGASLQLNGTITVSGEYLDIQGSGATGVNSTPRWFSQGPAIVQNGDSLGSRLNLVSGGAMSISADPTDTNVLYLAAIGGGAWRSVDGGAHWTPLFDSAYDGTSNLPMTSQDLVGGVIAVSPNNHRKIYFATGDPTNDGRSYYGRGVFVTTDSGHTWTQVLTPTTVVDAANVNPLDGAAISRLIIDPQDDDNLFVAAADNATQGSRGNAGIWRYTPTQGWYNMTGTTPGLLIPSPNGATTVTRVVAGSSSPGPEEDIGYNFNDFSTEYFSDLYLGPTYTHPVITVTGVTQAATGSLNGVNFTAVTAGAAGNNITIVYTGGGTAGTEQVTVNGTDITVVVDAAFSTINQVVAAINGNAAAAALVTASGTGTTPVGLGGPVNLSGGSTAVVTTTFVNVRTLLFSLEGEAVFRTDDIFSDQPNWYIYDSHTQAPGGGLTAFLNPRNADISNGFIGLQNQLIRVAASFGEPTPLTPINPYGTAYAAVTRGATITLYKSVGSYTPAGVGYTDYRAMGELWTQLNVPNYYGGSEFSSILVNQNDPRIVYVAGARLIYRSVDGGTNWENITVDANGWSVSPSINTLAFDGNGRILVATDEGVWRLTDNGVGNFSWTPGYSGNIRVGNLNGEGLAITRFVDVSGSTSSTNTLAGGAAVMGTLITTAIPTWTKSTAGTGSFGGHVQYDPNDPTILYRTQDGQLQRSTNSGATFTTISPVGGALSFPVFVIDPIVSSRILWGGGGGVYESLDRGNSWRYLFGPSASSLSAASFQGDFVPEATGPFSGIADKGSDAYDSDTIWALSGDTVSLTKDKGNNWDNRTSNLPRDLVSITVDPRNRDTAYVIRDEFGGSKVWRTTDAGENWVNITSDLVDFPVRAFAIDPRTGDLYVGNDVGVYIRGSSSSSWVKFGAGLPQVVVTSIDFNTNLNTINIGTWGRGAFTLWLDPNNNPALEQAALAAVSGNAVWNGPIVIQGDTVISAQGTQDVPSDTLNASLTLLGSIQDSGTSFTLTKVGLGDVILGGDNTYTGATYIQEGVIVVKSPTALGSGAGDTFVANGTALEIQSNVGTPSSPETVHLIGRGTDVNGRFGGAVHNVSNFNVFHGDLILERLTASDPTEVIIGASSGSQLTVLGVIRDSVANITNPALSKDLTGRLILAGDNTYTGATTVYQGELQLQSALALGASGPGNGTIVYNGAQLSLNSANSSTPAGFTVANEPLTLSGKGLFDGTDDLGALYNIQGNNTWTGSVSFNTIADSTSTVTPPNLIGIGVARPADVLTLSGNITQVPVPPNTDYGLRKLGPGVLALSGNNSYTETTYVEAGYLRALSNTALGTTANGTIVVDGAALQLQGGITITGETLNVQGEGPSFRGALESISGDNIWDGRITLDNSTVIYVDAGTLGIRKTTGSPNAIVNNAAAATFDLTKDGAGQLNLLGPNATFMGYFTVRNGVAQISSNTSLGTSTGIADGTTVEDGGTLRVLGASVATMTEFLTLNGPGYPGTTGALEVPFASSATTTWNAPITLATSSSIGVTGSGTLVVPTVISEGSPAASLTKNGNGALTLSGAASNSYTGATIVNDGLLNLAKTGGAQPFGGDLTIGDTIGAANSAVVRLLASNEIPDASVVDIQSDGRLDLQGFNETLGTLQILDGNVATGGGVLNVASLSMTGGTITLGSSPVVNLILTGGIAAISSAAQTATITGAGQIDIGGIPRTFDVADGPAEIDMAIASQITGGASAEIVKTGDGVLSYQSATLLPARVMAGILQVDGNVERVVLEGGTLGGTGSVQNGFLVAAASSGVVNPGEVNQAGTLTVGTSGLAPGSSFFVDVFTASTHDLLIVNGSIDLNNATLDGFIDSALPLDGTQIPIIEIAAGAPLGSSVIGRFAQGDSAFVGGQKVDITYTSTAVYIAKARTVATLAIATSLSPTVYGQSITITITATPEPGAGPVENDSPIQISIVGPGPSITPTPFLVYMSGNFAAFTFPQTAAIPPYLTPALPVLEVGSHLITATLLQTNNFKQATSPTLTQQVDKSNTQVAITTSVPSPVFGQPFNVVANFTAVSPGSGVPTGTATFAINGGAASAPVSLVGGQAVFPITGLGAGPHSVIVSYQGDSHFNTVTSTSTAFTINKSATSINLNAAPASTTFGQSVTFTATVSPVAPGAGTPTGTVLFFDTFGGTRTQVASRTLSGGSVVFTTTSLFAGNHSIDVVYVGDSNFLGLGDSNPSGAPINPTAFTVAKQAVNQALISSVPAGSTFGQSVTFTATISASSSAPLAPTGTMTFRIDGVPIVGGPVAIFGGQASFSTNNLPPGPHTITATYSGDNNFLDTIASPASVSQPVAQAATSLTILSTVALSSYGQSVTFRATVSPSGSVPTLPTGNVIFSIDGVDQAPVAVTQATGQANFTIANLAPKSSPGYAVAARYVGDTNFLTSNSATINQIVTKGTTAINLSSSLNGPSFPVYGTSVTITATVAPQFAGGTRPSSDIVFSYVVSGVTQSLTRTLDAAGMASITINDILPPSAVITANYAGDANYLVAPQQSLTQIVNNANTTTSVNTASFNSVYSTDNVTATIASVVLGGVTPTGTVAFTLNKSGGGTIQYSNIPVVAGVATMPHPPAGIYTSIVAVFTPTASTGYNSSSGTLNNQIISAATSAVALSASPTSGKFGGTVVFQAIVSSVNSPASPTGQVVFRIDGVDQTPVAINGAGVAIFSTNTLSANLHPVSATFVDPNGNFLNSTSPGPFNYLVDPGDTTVTVPAPSQSIETQTATIVATVSPVSPAAGVPDGQVRFTIDSVTQVTVDLVGGQATLTTSSLGVGPHTIVADYLGSTDKYNVSTTTFTHTVSPKNTTTTITSSNGGSAPYSTATTLTATVTHAGPTPTGSITFTVDGGAPVTVSMTNGAATLPLSQTLAVGSHTIVAQYNSNDIQFTPSTGTFTQTFTVAATATTLTANPTVVLASQPVTLTAVVAVSPATGGPLPTGNVEFRRIVAGVPTSLGSASLTGGVASITTAPLPVGSATYDAIFTSIDANIAGSTGTFTGTVATTTTVQSTAATGVYGQPVISARVTPAVGLIPTGSVRFIVRSGAATVLNTTVPLDAAAVATLNNVAPLGPGNYTITAVYIPAPTETVFPASTSAPFSQTITRAASGMTLASSSPSGAKFGDTIVFTATLTAQSPSVSRPVGNVVFMVAGQPHTVPLVAAGTGISRATLRIAGLPVGDNVVTAKYNLTSSFAAVSANLTQQVNAIDTVVALSATPNPAFFTQNVTFVATVGAVGSAAVPTSGMVTFFVDGTPQAVVPVNTLGQAQFSQVYNTAGNRNVVAAYSGGGGFNASTSPTLVESVNSNPIIIAVPASARSGDVFGVTVTLLRAGTTQADTSFFGAVTLALNSGPAGGTFATMTGNAAAGVITFNVALAKAGIYTFKVSAAGLPFIASSPVNVTARQLNVLTANFVPASAAMNFTLNATDFTGGIAGNFTGPITVTLAAGPANGGTIYGATTGTFTNGSGSVNGLKFTANGKYTLRFTANGLSVDFLVDTQGRVTGS